MRRYRANPRLRASLWLALKIETMDRQFFAAGIGVPGQLALDARLRATYPPPSTHRTPPGATLSLTLIDLSMQEAHQLRGPIRFGIFELDLRAGELRKNGLRVRLQEQPFQVLAMLVEHPGEVVGREELQKKLWPADTFVDFDHGLNKVINKIREALGDSAESPRFVQTVARRGYRFLAEVRVSDAAPVRRRDLATQPQPASEARDRPDLASKLPTVEHFLPPIALKILVFVLISLVASAAIWRLYFWYRPSLVIRSLAVLPLESLSSDASQDYFADGMTEELISDLGQISTLRVISRTSAMVYKHARKPLPQIAHELNVDAVVEGTVLRSGDRVRITAQLIEASTDKHLWSQSYEGELRDTLTLQNKVAKAIADQIRINLNPQEQAALSKATVVNQKAQESYLKGRYFWNKRTADGLSNAIDYFNEAIKRNPDYAQAYAGLADSYALAGDWKYGLVAPREAYPKAKAAATKAIALDGTLGEAHISLAFGLDNFDWDWESAGREFTRGIELNPGYATGHEWYGWHLAALGRHGEAVAEVEKASSLDPLSPSIGADLAEELLVAHRFDEAIKQSRNTMILDPFFAPAHYVLGQALVQKHNYKEAIAELQKAIELSPGSTAFTANLAYAYAVSGMRDEAVKILNDLKNRSPQAFSNAPEIAMVYVGLGEKDQAMAWLEKGYAERFSPWVLMRPCFDPLRSDPGFQDLLRRIGLPRL
jgi:TolB-like protein/DNA-binding winged helix-turn-helix (wHTH) protein/Flp pilus assembly protein TadD